MANATQDQVLGALLGMAIGDAIGMPVAGWERSLIAERFGAIDWFHRRVFPDGNEIKAGEFTDESEIALCIVESLTTNNGVLDLDNIIARMQFLARGEAKRWMHPGTLDALARQEAEEWTQAPLHEDDPASADVATRGIPIGLLYAIGRVEPGAVERDCEAVVRVTHGSPLAISAATAVGLAINRVGRDKTTRQGLPGSIGAELGGGAVGQALVEAQRLVDQGATAEVIVDSLAGAGQVAEVVASGIAIAALGRPMMESVCAAVNVGGATDTRGAITGAIVGTAVGSAGIPQPVIDDLEGRIYVSLAAPWFYRAAQRRGGQLIELRPER